MADIAKGDLAIGLIEAEPESTEVTPEQLSVLRRWVEHLRLKTLRGSPEPFEESTEGLREIIDQVIRGALDD